MSSPLKAGAVIFAKDVARVARFYEQLLSFSVVHTSCDYVVLDSKDIQLVIHAIPTRIADSISISVPPVVRAQTPIKLIFPVANLVEARASASFLGGQVGAADKEWGTQSFRACDGHDPEGNVFQLRQTAP
jgi:predicted enzyme related to lactoylglutathione lyase